MLALCSCRLRISVEMLPRSDWNRPSIPSIATRMSSHSLIWRRRKRREQRERGSVRVIGAAAHSVGCPQRGRGTDRCTTAARQQRPASASRSKAHDAWRAAAGPRFCAGAARRRHLRVQRRQAAALRNVVLHRCQLRLAQLGSILPAVLAGVHACIRGQGCASGHGAPGMLAQSPAAPSHLGPG